MADQPTPETQKPRTKPRAHEVTFTTYPKLLFIWPIILAGFVLYPFGKPAPTPPPRGAAAAETQPAAAAGEEGEWAEGEVVGELPAHRRLETLAWIYIWLFVVVLMTLGVDVDRNQFVFWLVVVALFWVGGYYLKDVRGITVFGDVYAWFGRWNIQYDRAFGLCLSLIMLVPYVVMIGWAWLNDRWRITHNEFEHYSLGKMDDSLGRGAKTIRTSFPDVLELILGMAGTLVVYNATGTKELRRIPHVMFLPFVRKRLNQILERTAITAYAAADEEEDDDEV